MIKLTDILSEWKIRKQQSNFLDFVKENTSEILEAIRSKNPSYDFTDLMLSDENFSSYTLKDYNRQVSNLKAWNTKITQQLKKLGLTNFIKNDTIVYVDFSLDNADEGGMWHRYYIYLTIVPVSEIINPFGRRLLDGIRFMGLPIYYKVLDYHDND
jgi:hypothetical protein